MRTFSKHPIRNNWVFLWPLSAKSRELFIFTLIEFQSCERAKRCFANPLSPTRNRGRLRTIKILTDEWEGGLNPLGIGEGFEPSVLTVDFSTIVLIP